MRVSVEIDDDLVEALRARLDEIEDVEVHCDGRCDTLGCRGHALREFEDSPERIDPLDLNLLIMYRSARTLFRGIDLAELAPVEEPPREQVARVRENVANALCGWRK